MSNIPYDTEVYSLIINDLFDNYLLFIHNIQIQQSNLLTLNTSIHNSFIILSIQQLITMNSVYILIIVIIQQDKIGVPLYLIEVVQLFL